MFSDSFRPLDLPIPVTIPSHAAPRPPELPLCITGLYLSAIATPHVPHLPVKCHYISATAYFPLYTTLLVLYYSTIAYFILIHLALLRGLILFLQLCISYCTFHPVIKHSH